ncbi:uncharacterized protein MEP-1 isoform X1 [Drosophila kikkawai]|uniref:MOG interacting and ectopic P-granules protein 1 n=1 Tax=Drosophila kikkawai TaxID=30033 RepID=A0A6P4IJK4_DROKI|nr:uncharacterized protein LOC108075155 isoform X1 [Drosophila kikkawai]
MTEVDVALPEGVAEPTTKLASASNSPQPEPEPQPHTDSPQPAEKEEVVEKEQQPEKLKAAEEELEGNEEKLEKNIEIPAVAAAKEDDVTDVTEALPKAPAPEELTEEDDEEDLDGEDSQITSTSSKEPKLNEDELEEEVEEEEATTNGDHEPDAEDEDEAEKIGSTAENSCEAEDPLGAAATVEEVNLLTSKKASLEEGESEEDALQDDEEEELDLSAKKANGFAKQKENGQASASEVSGVVNLDDEDSDEEMEDLTARKVPVNALEKAAKPPATINHNNNSGNESSDDAVLIASDSEPETSGPLPQQPPVAPAKKLSPVVAAAAAAAVVKATPPPPEDDDDDDDCVVIEDDTPPSISPSIGKRKNELDELQMQPSHKRQRSSTPSGLGQLTIKDARSLMQHDGSPVVTGAGGGPRDSVYPVTITNAVTGAATNLGIVPPKLVPMSTMNASPVQQQLNPPTLSLTGLPSMTNNANLLPGLTDDMFVLEAPSFIVPYIYEKPPHENICEVVKAIETKYELSAEDLAEADKGDEFDMMTEQNKEDKPAEQGGGGKKKKKRGDDESWSEQSDDDDDDDDDDDSESGVRTKVLIKEANDDLTALKGAIKPAAALAATGGVTSTTAGSKPGQENYFESPLGKFFMDIGVGLVQEYVQADLLRLQKRKMRKAQVGSKEFEMAINALSGNLQASKTKNAPFKFRMKRCEFCNFKSESAMAMANHYETPHMNGVLYKCNFCTFEIRNATEIVYHMEAVHNIKARLIKPLPYHQCPNCGFEDNGKAKLARHQPVCAKKFRPELNLAPPNDWEAPAKIPRIKPRHGLVGTATAYQAMAAQAAAQKAALANIQQQQAAAQARNLQAAALAAQNAAKMRQRAPQPPKQNMVRNPAPVRGAGNSINAGLALPNSYQLAAGQLVQQASKKPMAGQPSISITPLPRQSSVGAAGAGGASSSKVPPAAAGMKPGQSPSGNNKAQFVICEICDGYIKDLEQLRNHMQWMHKVKIHPKMIYNRPPLNCQKCQFRFFTDQGLERHLLGSHGLVTSSMQEAANKGKDAGRCPVCGRMYQWKLLNHVSRDHHMTLKPAHLSYKCTVCTATFGMYKQFETHVYTAHSTVARKAMDSKKNSAQSSSGSGSGAGMSSRSSLGAANDSLLKPLKINDEITIIPQPASKPRITNMESHVID